MSWSDTYYQNENAVNSIQIAGFTIVEDRDRFNIFLPDEPRMVAQATTLSEAVEFCHHPIFRQTSFDPFFYESFCSGQRLLFHASLAAKLARHLVNVIE
jgi:hypothetical protein